ELSKDATLMARPAVPGEPIVMVYLSPALPAALTTQPIAGHLPTGDAWRLRGRGLAIRVLGRVTPEFNSFVRQRGAASHASA
ncbi:MAG: hypothetical protein B7Z15_20350, partial [Rhizobiales bacterium 32-66-8]